MSHRINYGDLKLNQAVIEIRYPDGYKYWDSCGKCILDIKDKTKDVFTFSELRGADECALMLKDSPSHQISFGYKHLTLSAIRLKNLDFFKNYGQILLDIVKENIGIKQITRAGIRFWYVYKTSTMDEADKIINELKLFDINTEKFVGFGEEVKAEKPRLLIIDKEVKMILNISAAESGSNDIFNKFGIQDDYTPKNCVLIDVDFYKEDLAVKDFSLDDFMHLSHKKIRDNISKILSF